MSVLEELKALETRVGERLRELEPLVNEYSELQQLADRMGIAASAATSTPASGAAAKRAAAGPRRQSKPKRKAGSSATSPTTAAPKRRRRASGGTKAPAGSRQQQVLELVRERPGITVPDLGRQLGVDSTSLYRVVHRLEQQGQLSKQGRELKPA